MRRQRARAVPAVPYDTTSLSWLTAAHNVTRHIDLCAVVTDGNFAERQRARTRPRRNMCNSSRSVLNVRGHGATDIAGEKMTLPMQTALCFDPSRRASCTPSRKPRGGLGTVSGGAWRKRSLKRRLG